VNIASADNTAWQVSDKGGLLALKVVLHKTSYVLPWSQFLYAEGGEDEARLVFATHDVIVKGIGLGELMADLAAHRLASLIEPPSSARFMGRTGRCVRELAVRKASHEEE